MTYYHRNYPWYQFGIDLALGSGIDYAVSEREKVFAPYLLVSMLPGATFTDVDGNVRTIVGEPIERTVASDGGPLAPTPWYLTPIAVAVYLLVIVAAIAFFDVRRMRVTRAADALYMAVAGVAGIVVTFLVFVSTHEATTPNWLIVWLNPLCFIVPVCIFIKKCRRLVLCYEILNFVALILLCVLWRLTVRLQIMPFGYLLLPTLSSQRATSSSTHHAQKSRLYHIYTSCHDSRVVNGRLNFGCPDAVGTSAPCGGYSC
jgi:hypothetical protein